MGMGMGMGPGLARPRLGAGTRRTSGHAERAPACLLGSGDNRPAGGVPRGVGAATRSQRGHPAPPAALGLRVRDAPPRRWLGYHPSRRPVGTTYDGGPIGTRTAPTKSKRMSGPRDPRREPQDRAHPVGWQFCRKCQNRLPMGLVSIGDAPATPVPDPDTTGQAFPAPTSRQRPDGVGWLPPLQKAGQNGARPSPDRYKDCPDSPRMDIRNLSTKESTGIRLPRRGAQAGGGGTGHRILL